MHWKVPPIIKVYEALGSLDEGRVVLGDDPTTAKVYSSSRNKYYEVTYDPASNSITANDSGSYWGKYLGYPSIAYLMVRGIITYSPDSAQALSGIMWKDVNVGFKNDFSKTEAFVREEAVKKGFDLAALDADLTSIVTQITKLNLSMLGKTQKPPEGY
jgi:hypothetical protein